MGKVKSFKLTAVMAASAAVLSGCDRNDSGSWQASTSTRTCVDAQGVRVADDRCTSGGGGHGYGFYYLGAGRTVPAEGERAVGGTSAPVPGVAYSDASRSFSIARGGFGGTGEAAGGGGEGGGAGE